MRIRVLILTVLLVFPAARGLAADDDFFSSGRFSLRAGVIGSLSGGGQTQKSIKKFSEVFVKGKAELDEGRFKEAEEDLHLARDLWPEFFGSDFLLALLYEKTGEPDASARYFKSYLMKLKALESGGYGISAPLIRSILPEKVESYEKASGLVRVRLAAKGIEIEGVRPMEEIPAFFYPALVVIMFVVFYAGTCFWALPKWRRHYKITHPPEGFWVCKACLAENPSPNKVCQECGAKR